MQTYAVSGLTSQLSTDNLCDGSGRFYADKGKPLVIEGRDAQLSNFTYDGEIYLGRGDFKLNNIKCKGIRLSQVKSLMADQIITDGADIGMTIIGSSNIWVSRSHFRNHRIGGEGLPGHPWTFKDEAAKRKIQWTEGNQWIPGPNLCGMLESMNKGIWFQGDGTNVAFVEFNVDLQNQWGITPYKLDSLPLMDSHIDIVSKKDAKIISETSKGFTVTAEGVFTKGLWYCLHVYNPAYEVRNIKFENCIFKDCLTAGLSFYFIAGGEFRNNIVDGSPNDYDIGLEHARNCVIEDNIAYVAPNDVKNQVRIGLLGRMERILIKSNNQIPVHFNAFNAPEYNLVADVSIGYVNGRSPFLSAPVVSPVKPISGRVNEKPNEKPSAETETIDKETNKKADQ